MPLWCMEGREERSWTAVEGERKSEVEGLCYRRCIVLMNITKRGPGYTLWLLEADHGGLKQQ